MKASMIQTRAKYVGIDVRWVPIALWEDGAGSHEAFLLVVVNLQQNIAVYIIPLWELLHPTNRNDGLNIKSEIN